MQGRRLKVLFLATWYPNEEGRVAGIFIQRHAEAVSRYCEVTVLYIHRSRRLKHARVESTVERGMPTVRVYLRKPIMDNRFFSELQLLDYLLSGYLAGRLMIKEFGRPDLIHLNVTLPVGLVGLLLSLLKGIPYVVSEHTGPLATMLDTPLARASARLVLGRAEVVLPVSSALKGQIDSFYKGLPCLVVPNAIDTQRFFPLASAASPRGRKVILFGSRLEDREKGVSGLLRAVKVLSQKRRDFELHIFGGGRDEENLKRQAEELGLKDMLIYFDGGIPNPELALRMRTSDFYVLNSPFESFSATSAEALSSGIPVISTRCGGPEDYLNDDVGLLIEPGNTEELVRAIDYMLDHHRDYDPTVLHQYAASRFSYDVVGARLVEIYRAVCRAAQRRG
ncbi:MAG: glycosyltransferase [Conexivisphaerales archaeon]